MPQQLFIELPKNINEMQLELLCTKSNCTLIQYIDYPTGPVYVIEANDPMDFFHLGEAIGEKSLSNKT